MQTILVTGATGTLGRWVVRKLVQKEHQTRILTRNANASAPAGVQISVGDLGSQSAINQATRGAHCIIHCAHNPARAIEDIESTQALLNVAAKNRVSRFVYISIVGVDRASAPYYKTKYRIEQIVTFRSVDPKDTPWIAWTGETHLSPEHRYGKITWREYLRRAYDR
jgi:uncharacterized protein YbjT (DUF2867 family)